MSALKNEFQTVRLPDIALADMYRQHLVIVEPVAARRQPAAPAPAPPKPEPLPEPLPETAVVAPPPQPQPQPTRSQPQPQSQPSAHYPVLGHFSRQVLVMVHDEAAVHCNDTSLAFLTKVISAVGLSMEHIAILNTHGKQVTY
ncbi:MAG TPA: hypothetical protein VLL95_06760, partial [Phnomibacter sp.]|nr:hypothetical protein [Phnomibacter sp.]